MLGQQGVDDAMLRRRVCEAAALVFDTDPGTGANVDADVLDVPANALSAAGRSLC